MAKLIVIEPKKGQPSTGGRDPFAGIGLSETMLAAIDAKSVRECITRSEALRRLVELRLIAETPAKKTRSAPNKVRAAELAAKTIDKMIDPAASSDERAQRRRRLTKGPPEFREDRVDLPKAKR